MANALFQIARRRRGVCVVTACVLICCHSWCGTNEGRSAPPTLAHLFPAGGQRGACVTTTCTGEFSWPVQVWAPGVDVDVDEEKGKLKIKIPDDLATDRVWIRLYNDEGSSAVIPFLIGGLKESDEQEPNDSPRAAQAVAGAGVTMNGTLQKNGDVDCFSIDLTAGQTLVAAVDAHSRLGSPMDPILQIVAPDGTLLSENHDDVGLDPRVAFTPSESGTFVVRLLAFPAEPDTTIALRGGANYIYRLTLTTGPFITHALPFTMCVADSHPVEVMGWNIPAQTKLPVVSLGRTLLADRQEYEVATDPRVLCGSQLGFVFSPSMAGAARVRLVPYQVIRAISADDSPRPLTVPTATAGWLRGPHQTDAYRVSLKKGLPFVIAVESPSLDLPTVPFIRLTDPTGAIAAEVEKNGPQQDAVITHTAAHDGDYLLTVGDRYAHGGDRYLYRLTIQLLDQADFALAVDTDAVVVSADAPTELPVTVQRHPGVDEAIGPITIEAIDLPEGVTAEAEVSEPEGPTADQVTISITTAGTAYSGPIRIRGVAAQPREVVRWSRTPARFGCRFETIWLTAVAQHAAATADAAAGANTP